MKKGLLELKLNAHILMSSIVSSSSYADAGTIYTYLCLLNLNTVICYVVMFNNVKLALPLFA